MTPSAFGDHLFDAHGDHCFGVQVPHPLPNTDVPGKSVPPTPATAEIVLPFRTSKPQTICSSL